ncbi:MAG: CPBP family intramembrane metalloprotease [Bacteroidetes bacterium]|nr:CPBP family intramembrane metalloprotease [Bacteroidota bacterium]
MRRIFINDNKVRTGWRIALLCLLVGLFSALVTVAWKSLGFPPQRSHGVIKTAPFVISGVIAFLVVMLSTYITMRITETRTIGTIGLTKNHWKRNVLLGLPFGIMTPLLVVTTYYLSGNASVHFNSGLSMNDVLISTMPFFVFFIFQSGFEELLFRGYGLQLFVEATGKTWAVIIIGALFGLAHSSNPGADIIGFLNTSLNGALLAVIVINTGSIILVWAYHAAWNIFSSLVLGFNVSGIQLNGSLFTARLQGAEWVTGGKFGFEASIAAGLIETATLILLICILKKYPIKEKGINYFQPIPKIKPGVNTRRVI